MAKINKFVSKEINLIPKKFNKNSKITIFERRLYTVNTIGSGLLILVLLVLGFIIGIKLVSMGSKRGENQRLLREFATISDLNAQYSYVEDRLDTISEVSAKNSFEGTEKFDDFSNSLGLTDNLSSLRISSAKTDIEYVAASASELISSINGLIQVLSGENLALNSIKRDLTTGGYLVSLSVAK